MSPEPDITSLDYAACEQEVLDKTGAFQSNGAVLLLNADAYSILGMSQNWPLISGLGADNPWPYADFFLSELLANPEELAQVTETPRCLMALPSLSRQRKPFELQAVRTGDVIFIEWIPVGYYQPLSERSLRTTPVSPAAVKAKRQNIYQTLQNFCEHLREVMMLDRVMIYQFDAQNAGDIVAENCREDWTPYLGLHYPATDIPRVARDLYLKVPSRQIYDSMSPPVALLTLAEYPASEIDLTACNLRSVSPYHLEYLQNMGVRSSLSMAIVHEGKLWGLLSCHHGQPLNLPLELRDYALSQMELIQECLVDWHAYQARIDAGYTERIYLQQTAQLDQCDSSDTVAILESLLLGNTGLESMVQAHAAAIYADGVVVSTGNVPPEHWMTNFVDAWFATSSKDLFVSNHLVEDSPIAADFSPETSGLMALRLSASPRVVLFAFRQESLHEVHWGGNPYAERDPGKPLSPRRSFQLWKETVLNQARPWTPLEVDCFQQFRELLMSRFSMTELTHILKDGALRLTEQIRQHTYIAKALTHGVQSGVAMAILESTDQPATLLHMNQGLQHLFSMPLVEEFPQNTDVDDALTHLGLTQEQIEKLGGIPQRMSIWSPRLGHRTVKMSRRNLLSLFHGDKRYAIVSFQFFDITAEERVENSLLAAHRQVDQADSAKLKFLTHTSNELLSPLKRVLQLSDGLHEELMSLSLDDLGLYTEQMTQASRHMIDRVEQLLFFARSASGHMLLELEPVDLQSLLQNCIHWLQGFAQKQEVRIQFEASSQPVLIRGNTKALQHMLVNLLDNAIRYSQSGATVHCRLRHEEQDEHVYVDIEDQGKGMSDYELAQVFTPFYSGSQRYGRDQQKETSGLGLTLVKHIVEAHRGNVDLQSAVNRGTQVRVALPQQHIHDKLELSIPYYGR